MFKRSGLFFLGGRWKRTWAAAVPGHCICLAGVSVVWFSCCFALGCHIILAVRWWAHRQGAAAPGRPRLVLNGQDRFTFADLFLHGEQGGGLGYALLVGWRCRHLTPHAA